MTNHWMKSDYFNDLFVIDGKGKSHIIPVVENSPWTLVDSVRIPLLHWNDTGGDFWELTAWTMYEEDMNQIIEQVVTRFTPIYKDLKLGLMSFNRPWRTNLPSGNINVLEYVFEGIRTF